MIIFPVVIAEEIDSLDNPEWTENGGMFSREFSHALKLDWQLKVDWLLSFIQDIATQSFHSRLQKMKQYCIINSSFTTGAAEGV